MTVQLFGEYGWVATLEDYSHFKRNVDIGLGLGLTIQSTQKMESSIR
jgi:hypothetical protein